MGGWLIGGVAGASPDPSMMLMRVCVGNAARAFKGVGAARARTQAGWTGRSKPTSLPPMSHNGSEQRFYERSHSPSPSALQSMCPRARTPGQNRGHADRRVRGLDRCKRPPHAEDVHERLALAGPL